MAHRKNLKTAFILCSILFLAPEYAGGCGGGAQADMVFIMDESGSVGYSNFQKMKEFVRDLVDAFSIGSNEIRVGVQKYSSGANTEFNLNSYYDKNAMKNRIMSISYRGGGTNTGGALKYCKDSMFTSSRGDRAGVPNIAIVLTDGRSWSYSDTATQARNLRNTGATIFSVGIGSGIPLAELNEMATDPDSQHVFAVSGFSALNNIKQTFQAQACPPTHGGWSAWSGWSSCTRTCGGGTKTHTRACNNPAPANGGSNCAGSSSESTSCNTQSCAVNGNWGNWGSWTSCSKSCATGSKSRSRACNNPAPANGGANCAGSSSSTTSCNTHACPIHGGFSSWTGWSSCSKSCGTGSKSRSRQCNNPTPQHGGNNCAGAFTENANCNTHPCPIDGGWTVWTAWGTCSTTCELGSWSRSRSCTNPAPAHGGAACSGVTGQTTSCNLRPCPVDGAWNSWQSWSACSVTCMGIGVRGRIRNCDNPTPMHGGATCPGAGDETQTCDKSLHLCSAGNGWAVSVYSTTPGTPVNGGWGQWGSWTACTKTCAAGMRLRKRNCDSPVPKFGGTECSGDYVEKELCGNVPCPGGSSYVQTCPERFFDCQNGNRTCVHFLKKCDCTPDCDDGSDEDPLWAGCSGSSGICNNPATLASPKVAVIAVFLFLAALLPSVWTRIFP